MKTSIALLAGMLFGLNAAVVSGQQPPDFPAGLWQNREEGFVIRIAPCGAGLCGFAAGAPANKRQGDKENPGKICGQQMLKDFEWNGNAKRWEGRMEPPGSGVSLKSHIVSDGKTYLTLTGKMVLITKTMSFLPYVGKIGANCHLE